jgi:Fe-Mn family superoxide dismutase
MIPHELYISGLGDESEAGPMLTEATIRDLGSVKRWQTEFIAMGRALGGGSGWVLLTYGTHDRTPG